MHQLQELHVRAGLTQLLDHPEADPAAAVDGDPGGLVQGDQVLVLQQDRELAGGRRPLLFGLGPLGQADRGHPHRIARLDPGVGSGPPLVHPHLTRADDAIDVGLGHALEVAHQEVVQALAGGFVVDLQGLDRACGTRLLVPYNVFH